MGSRFETAIKAIVALNIQVVATHPPACRAGAEGENAKLIRA
jgi:hypothetical protein